MHKVSQLPTSLPTSPVAEEVREVRRRMQMPQRHRLLHGYPLAKAMRERTASRDDEQPRFGSPPTRGLLVGVLPHSFCNPAVTGCGFCTFPHEKFRSDRATLLVEHVILEIEQRLRAQPALDRRNVQGLYFGGGTANLTPPDSFRKLCRKVADTFDMKSAEVTLEGVPIYFVKRRPLLLDVLQQELDARRFRISMGIQTFDEKQLRRMGRLAFGTKQTFEEVMRTAKARGFSTSSDLLFDLPGQSLAQMKDDVRKAIDLGLDHIGLYHLVMFRGLGTEWSRDPELLAGLPSNEQGAENWQALRELLLANGFYQATLTNFERAEARDTERRFQYEELSFQPHHYEMLGFGPSAISFTADSPFRTGFKTLNPTSSEEYLRSVTAGNGAWTRYFHYNHRDLQIFYATRALARLQIRRDVYRETFGTDLVEEFSSELSALASEGLVDVTEEAIRPTDRGMFYADTITALLARKQLGSYRPSYSEMRVPLPMSEEKAADAWEDTFNSSNGGHMG